MSPKDDQEAPGTAPGASVCDDPQARRAKDAARQRARSATFKARGDCIVCGRRREERISKTTGENVQHCKHCRIRLRAKVRRWRKRKLAEKAKTAAIVRLAAAHIERRRIQQARLDHGLPYSLSNTPILPKDLPPQRFEI